MATNLDAIEKRLSGTANRTQAYLQYSSSMYLAAPTRHGKGVGTVQGGQREAPRRYHGTRTFPHNETYFPTELMSQPHFPRKTKLIHNEN